jgi:hypothetical protein
MQRFNKTTAATLAGALTTIVGSFWVEATGEMIGAIQTILTAALVWLVPNRGA